MGVEFFGFSPASIVYLWGFCLVIWGLLLWFFYWFSLVWFGWFDFVWMGFFVWLGEFLFGFFGYYFFLLELYHVSQVSLFLAPKELV